MGRQELRKEILQRNKKKLMGRYSETELFLLFENSSKLPRVCYIRHRRFSGTSFCFIFYIFISSKLSELKLNTSQIQTLHYITSCLAYLAILYIFIKTFP